MGSPPVQHCSWSVYHFLLGGKPRKREDKKKATTGRRKKTKATTDKKAATKKTKPKAKRAAAPKAARDSKVKRGGKKPAARSSKAAPGKRDPTKAKKKEEPTDKRTAAILKYFQKNGTKTRETLFAHNYSEKEYRPDSLDVKILRDIQGKGADRVYVEVRCTWDVPESEETGPAHTFHEGVEVWVAVKNDGFKINVTWDFVRPEKVLEQYTLDDFLT